MSAATPPTAGLRIAIIGGGITGINLALGLSARNITSYTVYERAASFGEIGAGIGFSPNAETAMRLLDPSILTAYKTVANPNGEDYFQWVEGYSSDELLFKLYVGKNGFQGCRRSDVLEAWAQLVPTEKVRFGKTVKNIRDEQDGGDVVIEFEDGTEEHADVVIGCDGIRSRVRQILVPGEAAHAHYTGKYCFRALIPMDAAVRAIGPARAGTRFMYNGPGAHVITYPVGGNSVMNFLAVITDPSGAWPDRSKLTGPGSKKEVMDTFALWRRTVPRIVELLPEAGNMDKWAVFDMAEYPASGYAKGRVCVAGDAAHATGPHLGAGGGLGIEDALALAVVLARVNERVVGGEVKEKGKLVERALEAYDKVRYQRTQWVVRATRKAVDLFQWREPRVARNPKRFGEEISKLFFGVWEYDVEGMVREVVERVDGRLVPN